MTKKFSIKTRRFIYRFRLGLNNIRKNLYAGKLFSEDLFDPYQRIWKQQKMMLFDTSN